MYEDLELFVVSESLESGKSGMDKNTYKALNTSEHKNIVYKMTKVNNIDCSTAGKCEVNATGSLTIAGNTKPIKITFNAEVKGDNITLTGSTPLKMSEYKVDPPTAMFGTIKTGDEVNIKFDSTFQNNSQSTF